MSTIPRCGLGELFRNQAAPMKIQLKIARKKSRAAAIQASFPMTAFVSAKIEGPTIYNALNPKCNKEKANLRFCARNNAS